MTLAGRLRARRLRDEIGTRAAGYAGPGSEPERLAWQLQQLNQTWQRSLERVPFYRELQRQENLPSRFESLAHFAESVPPVDKRTLQERGAELVDPARPPDFVRMTGGSTAEPVQIPAWSSELGATAPDQWLGRSWYGIRPDSKLFMLWGHSHLLGTGLRGWLNGRRRAVSDRLLGYQRFSAYDLRPEAMRRAAEALLRFRPDYVIGYSVALDAFARVVSDRRPALRALGLKAVVATAESFPSEQSPALLEDCFGCPVAMEYGAVETGLVAHTHPEGGFRVFWRSYLVELAGAATTGPLRLTALYPRCVPLFRYDIGDEAEIDAADLGSVGLTRLRRVLGRCNDFVRLDDGTQVHSEAFSHAVRPSACVRAYQVVSEGGRLRLAFTAASELPESEETAIRGRLGRIHDALAGIPLERVEQLEQTIAGKTPMILRR